MLSSEHKLIRILTKVALGLVSFYMFLVALAIMKTGAAVLAPTLQGSIFTDSLPSALGFGWLSALLVMSGSPIAVSALALYAGGSIDQLQAFMMLGGSRLGSSWVVLTVALIYAYRHRNSNSGKTRATLSIGVYTLVLTGIVYGIAAVIGIEFLRANLFERLTFAAPVTALDIFNVMTAPIVDFIKAVFPALLIFPSGVAFLLLAMKGFDYVIPEFEEDSIQQHSQWRDKTLLMFGLGSLIALVTMSVSIALTILIPLVAKGAFRREHAIPYILGANIATLGDTLLAAAVIGVPGAVEVVIVEVISALLVTLILLLFYKPLVLVLTRFTDYLLDNRRALIAFLVILLLVPIGMVILL